MESYSQADPYNPKPLRYMGWAIDLSWEEGSWTYRIYAPDTEDHGPTASETGFGSLNSARTAALIEVDRLIYGINGIKERAKDMEPKYSSAEGRIRVLFARGITYEETVAEIAAGGKLYRGHATLSPRDRQDPFVGAVIAALRAKEHELLGISAIGQLDSCSPVFSARGFVTIPNLDRYAVEYTRMIAYNMGRRIQSKGKHPLCKSEIAFAVAMEVLSREPVGLELGQNLKARRYQTGLLPADWGIHV